MRLMSVWDWSPCGDICVKTILDQNQKQNPETHLYKTTLTTLMGPHTFTPTAVLQFTYTGSVSAIVCLSYSNSNFPINFSVINMSNIL